MGNRTFYKDEPVLYFDTLKTSTIEGAATTVYATGGRGNSRLIAWEGERTVTFTMEDALISPEGFAILSGAGIIDASESKPAYVHTTSQVQADGEGNIYLDEVNVCWNGTGPTGLLSNSAADIFVMVLEDGEIIDEPCIPNEYTAVHKNEAGTYETVAELKPANAVKLTCLNVKANDIVLVDYYVMHNNASVKTIEITADKFAGNYYLEASTLFRREKDGVDMPAEFIIPNGKIQSNFTFSMASSGDPSTFTFTMDAFPDYTKFDPTKKVLFALQIIGEETDGDDEGKRTCVARGE